MCAPTTRRSHREKILWDHEIYSSIILCVHPPRRGLTVRKSWGTTRFTHPSYYLCTHHEEVSPWENLVGPRDLPVHNTLCAPATRRSYREKILWDQEICPSIILCVHPPQGDLTVRKSWGTTRFTRPSYYLCTHHEEVSTWEILWDHEVFSWSKGYFLDLP